MSDYMFMLENHLTAEQARALAEVAAAAAQASVNLFLTGGAVRDMIGGSPIRDRRLGASVEFHVDRVVNGADHAADWTSMVTTMVSALHRHII